jgi:23S rRNA (guanosine2251-2'-O)-methyltransferase
VRSASRGGRRMELTGTHPIEEALRARRRPLYELWMEPGPEGEPFQTLAQAAGVPVAYGTDCGPPGPGEGPLPRLVVGPLPELGLEELAALDGTSSPLLVALDGVEDPQNLGAIARVAEAAGATGLILTQRRSPPLSPAVSRASAGAIEWLPVARTPNLRRALRALKQLGFWVFGADPEGGESLYELAPRWRSGPRVLVLGAEGRGLRAGVAQELDLRVRIPMVGQVASLNVATAAAVLLFDLARSPGSPPGVATPP